MSKRLVHLGNRPMMVERTYQFAPGAEPVKITEVTGHVVRVQELTDNHFRLSTGVKTTREQARRLKRMAKNGTKV